MEEWQYFDEDPRLSKQAKPVEPSTLQRAGQFAGGLLTRAAQGPFKLAEQVEDIFSNPAAASASLPLHLGAKASQLIKNKYKIPQASEGIERLGKKKFGDIEPENFLTKGLQYTAGNWPALFAGGAPTAEKIGADIAGSAALALSENITKNPLVGIGAHILGQKKFNDAANYLKKAPKEIGKIRSYISKLYDTEKELGSKIPVSANKIKESLGKINDEVAREYVNPGKFDEAARNRVITNLQNAEKSLTNPKLTAADLSAEKRALNNAWSPKNSTENDYYNKIKKAFTSDLDNLSQQYSKWGNAYKTSDELYQIDKWQSNLGRWVENNSGKGFLSKLVPNATAQSGLAILGGLAKGTPYAIAGAVAPAVGKAAVAGKDIAQKAGKFLVALGKTNDGRKLLMNIVADSAKENSNALIKNIHKFNKMADKYDQEESQWEYFD